MRSSAEILFRLRQEAANLWLYAFPPGLKDPPAPRLALLPDPEAVAAAIRGSRRADETKALADKIVSGALPLLGVGDVPVGNPVAWRRDYLAGIETEPVYFRRVPYLDATRVGDHKVIWEINRHQQLVLVAQAARLTGDTAYIRFIERQIVSWLDQNPFQRGINWASALEVAFRALSWIWIYHLVGRDLDPGVRARMLEGLYRHGWHLEFNLSVYFSPNTHLLGEALALHAIGLLFPEFPNAARWRRTGREWMLRDLSRQVRPDGSHFEQSSYYHLYTVDFYFFHHLLEPLPPERLRALSDYLSALTGPSGVLPLIGDDDGGRFFHPFGERRRFSRATLATCSAVLGVPYPGWSQEDLMEQAVWWLGPDRLLSAPLPSEAARPESRAFTDSAMVAMTGAGWHVLFDAGPFGSANAGHSHSDTLSLVVSRGEAEVLSDPGTFTYVGDPAMRDWFRGSGAHNTVRLDGQDQAKAAGPFRWTQKPQVQLEGFQTSEGLDYAQASWSNFSRRHRRRVWLDKEHSRLVVLDEITGEGECLVELFWHSRLTLSRRGHGWALGDSVSLTAEDGWESEIVQGWRSAAYGHKETASVLCFRRAARLPVRVATVIDSRVADSLPTVKGETVEVNGSVYAYGNAAELIT